MINLKPLKGWRGYIALFVCLFCLSLGTVQAASPFFWDSIDVDMTLETDGDLLVTETQKYVFTQPHTNERYRYIPLDGINRITDVAVYENNEPVLVNTGNRHNHFWIRWHHELTAPETHTFVLKYRVIGGVQVKGNRSQIYWNALFPERSAAINRGTVTVHVPDALAGQVHTFRSEGVGSRDRKLNPTTFEFVTHGPLDPQQFLTIRLGFPSNSLDIPQAQTSYWVPQKSPFVPGLPWAALGSFIMLVVLVVGTMIAGRKRCPNCGKLALKRSSRIVQYATSHSSGRRDINHACRRCNYERTFSQTIPRKSSSRSSASWSGSCSTVSSCSSGGSSGCSSGGGGGGCGSSGCGGGGCGGGG